jgi:hypothetical protein
MALSWSGLHPIWHAKNTLCPIGFFGDQINRGKGIDSTGDIGDTNRLIRRVLRCAIELQLPPINKISLCRLAWHQNTGQNSTGQKTAQKYRQTISAKR